MKKTIGFSLLFLCLILGQSADASLTLMTNADGQSVVYNDVSDTYWYPYLNQMPLLTYSQQLTFISNLNTPGNEYYGLNNWHMATNAEFQNEFSFTVMSNLNQIYETFRPTRIEEIAPGRYTYSWAGRVDTPYVAYRNTHLTWSYYMDTGNPIVQGSSQGYMDDEPMFGPGTPYYAAWVTADAPSAVPIPAAIWLFGPGLAGLIAIRRRIKK